MRSPAKSGRHYCLYRGKNLGRADRICVPEPEVSSFEGKGWSALDRADRRHGKNLTKEFDQGFKGVRRCVSVCDAVVPYGEDEENRARMKCSRGQIDKLDDYEVEILRTILFKIGVEVGATLTNEQLCEQIKLAMVGLTAESPEVKAPRSTSSSPDSKESKLRKVLGRPYRTPKCLDVVSGVTLAGKIRLDETIVGREILVPIAQFQALSAVDELNPPIVKISGARGQTYGVVSGPGEDDHIWIGHKIFEALGRPSSLNLQVRLCSTNLFRTPKRIQLTAYAQDPDKVKKVTKDRVTDALSGYPVLALGDEIEVKVPGVGYVTYYITQILSDDDQEWDVGRIGLEETPVEIDFKYEE